MYRDAALVLADAVPGEVTWAVTASANLALRGIPIEPGDVDVMTTADGAYRIAELFDDRVLRPVRPPDETAGERIRSHYGAVELAGTEVELMGDVEHFVDGEWVPADDPAEREFVEVEGRRVPAMPLEHELRGYRELGREDRAALVEAHLS